MGMGMVTFFFQIGKGITFTIPWFKKGIIHFGNYHYMHYSLIASIISIILYFIIQLPILLTLSFIFEATFIWFLVLYFLPILKIKPLSKFFTFAKIRYMTNKSFIKGAKDGQSKFNAICIEPSW